MIILRKYWSKEYKKVAIGFVKGTIYFVLVISNDGIKEHHSFSIRY